MMTTNFSRLLYIMNNSFGGVRLSTHQFKIGKSWLYKWYSSTFIALMD